MRMYALCFAYAAIASAVGCSYLNNSNALQATEYTCASATAALKIAVAQSATLSAGSKAKITHAVVILNPICSQPNVPTLDSTAQAALNAALAELTAVIPAVPPAPEPPPAVQ